MNQQEKYENLKKALSGYDRVAVCFSGGVDSTFLAKIAIDVLGSENVLALLADTPSMPRTELESARSAGDFLGLSPVEVMTCEIEDPVYVSNPVDRCYHCKKIIFGALIAEAESRGFKTVLDGNNADDQDDYRPGHIAAVELGVISPLMDAGLNKQEIRDLSRFLGLPTADKPALACLSTRVAPGCRISRELLARIEQAEQVLWDAGFAQVRVRDNGEQARLEVAEEDFRIFSDVDLRKRIVEGVKEAGYKKVVLDLVPLVRR